MDEKVDRYYQMRAKEIVDLLFDRKFFKDDVTRDDMAAVENFIGWTIQVNCKAAVTCALLTKKSGVKHGD